MRKLYFVLFLVSVVLVGCSDSKKKDIEPKVQSLDPQLEAPADSGKLVDGGKRPNKGQTLQPPDKASSGN